jgi:hypothetical protein
MTGRELLLLFLALAFGNAAAATAKGRLGHLQLPVNRLRGDLLGRGCWN